MRRAAILATTTGLLLSAPGGTSIGEQPGWPACATLPADAVEQEWRVVVTGTRTAVDGRTRTVFVATVLNLSKGEQILFTPGLVGPVLYKRDPSYSPLQYQIPRRKGADSCSDYVKLRPGDGFSRSFVCRVEPADLTHPLSRVGAWLMLYEKGPDGPSYKVAKVIEAAPYEVPE